MKLALVLAVSVLASCLGLAAEGEETLRVRNAKAEPVRAIIRIDQASTGLRILTEDLTMKPHSQIDYVLGIRPGTYRLQIDTTSSVNELLAFDIPEAGDTLVELVFTAEGARLSVRGT